MKLLIFLPLCLFLVACQSTEEKKHVCLELYKITGEQKFHHMEDCSKEWASMAQEAKILKELQQARHVKESQKTEWPRDLMSLDLETRTKYLEPLRLKICDELEKVGKNGLPKANAFTVSITYYEKAGFIYGVFPETPNAVDIQKTYFSITGQTFCTEGGFTGGNCSEIMKQQKVKEAYTFTGNLAETATLAGCQD